MLRPVPPDHAAAAAAAPTLRLPPRRLLAIVVAAFAAGFLAGGYVFQQPSSPAVNAEALAAVARINADLDRQLQEQRRLLDCSVAAPPSHASPAPTPAKETPR